MKSRNIFYLGLIGLACYMPNSYLQAAEPSQPQQNPRPVVQQRLPTAPIPQGAKTNAHNPNNKTQQPSQPPKEGLSDIIGEAFGKILFYRLNHMFEDTDFSPFKGYEKIPPRPEHMRYTQPPAQSQPKPVEQRRGYEPPTRVEPAPLPRAPEPENK